MGDRKLTAPRVIVYRDGLPDLEVQTNNADMIRWDLTRPKQRPAWPTMQEAPILWMTFVAWAAAQRTGAIEPAYTWDKWAAEVLEVSNAEDPEADEAGMGAPFPTGEQGAADL
jgi:hypothetical protein